MKNTVLGFVAVLILLTGSAVAAEVRFTAAPTARTVGDEVDISFTVSGPTDVAVAILNARGEVVRHLAAGAVGDARPSPAPLVKGLAQKLTWDRTDDGGRPAAEGPFKVRVALGLRAEFDRVIGWSGQNIDRPRGMVCGPDGTLYALWGGGFRAHRQTTLITAYDREGRYLRQVFPGPANLPPEKCKGWPRIKLDSGEELPVVFQVTTRCPYPGVVFGNRVFPAVTGDGRLVILSGAETGTGIKHPDLRGGRRLLILGTDGSVPADFLGPVVAGENLGGFGHVALTPDDKHAYVGGLFEGGRKGRGLCHVVYRVPLDGSEPAKVFVGKPYTAGKGTTGLNDPQGLATDTDGNLYVADYGNNRIAVFKPDGSFRAEIPVKFPDQVRVSRRTGAIYVVALHERKKPISDGHWYNSGHNWKALSLVAFGSINDPTEKASFAARKTRYGGGALLALDGSVDPPVLWFVDNGWGRHDVTKIVDRGARLESVGDPINSRVKQDTALPFVGAIAVAGKQVLVRRRVVVNRPVVSLVFNADTGLPVGTFAPKDEKGNDENYWTQVWTSQVVGQHDTRVYVHGGNQTGRLRRYDISGKASAFQVTGSHVLELPFPDRHTHNTTLFATREGDIFMALRKEGQGQARPETILCVTVVGPDGTVKHDCLIPVQAARLGGLAVDSKGNIYLGAQVVPKGAARIPVWFKGRLPKDSRHRHPSSAYNQYGAILKFPPTGGQVMIDPKGNYVGRRGWSPRTKFQATVRVRGALWLRRGGLVPAKEIGCNCETTRIDVDEYDRLFVPDVLRFSVRVFDSEGNELTHFGGYGNMDSRGPQSPVPTPAIPFGWPVCVECAGGRVYVADLVNRRVVAVRLGYATEATVAIK